MNLKMFNLNQINSKFKPDIRYQVRIKSSKLNTFWYCDKIGNEYIVKKIFNDNTCGLNLEVDQEIDGQRKLFFCIDEDDCEIIRVIRNEDEPETVKDILMRMGYEV